MGNPLNNVIGNAMGGMMGQNPMLQAFSQMMKGKIPIDQMLQQNPNLRQYWNEAQTMAKGKSDSEGWQMVNQLCKQKGVDFNQLKAMMR